MYMYQVHLSQNLIYIQYIFSALALRLLAATITKAYILTQTDNINSFSDNGNLIRLSQVPEFTVNVMDLFEQKPRTVYNIMQELDLVHEKWLKQNNSARVCVCELL